MKKEKRNLLLVLVLSILLSFTGLAYFLYLQVVFPSLIPHYGSGERFTLNAANNYTFQIPWSAYSRLHLTLQANETVKLYSNSDYVCDCTSYDFIIEPGDEALILLKSTSPVSGMFTAWQETPLEKQLLALTMLLAGLTGIATSIKIMKKKKPNLASGFLKIIPHYGYYLAKKRAEVLIMESLINALISNTRRGQPRDRWRAPSKEAVTQRRG